MKHIVALSLLAALTPACTEKGGETSDSSTGAMTEATDATTDPTTDGTDGTGTSGSTSDATTETTTGASDSEGSTTEPTTGASNGLCEAYAAWWVMCGMPPGSEAEIATECENQRALTDAVYGPKCGALSDTFVACVTMSACGDEAACADEMAAVEDCLPEAGPVCVKFGEAVAACEPGEDPAEVASSCQFELNAGAYMNPACGAAAEAAYECYGGLTCEQLGDESDCEAEAMAYDMKCGGEEGAPARPGALEFNSHRR